MTSSAGTFKAQNIGILAAIMTIYFFVPTHGIISSSLAIIAKTYPSVSPSAVSYLVTIVNLAMIPAAFFFGILAGRTIKFKTLTLIALLLFAVAGGIPYFFRSTVPFGVFIVSRALFGLGLGCFFPIVTSLISKMFPNETARASLMGLGSVFFNIGAILGTTIGGFLALVRWQNVFLFYIFGLIPFMLVAIFMKEPEQEAELKKEKIKLPAKAYLYLIVLMCSVSLGQLLWNYMAIVMDGAGYSPAVTGMLLSAFLVGAIGVAVLFGLIYRVFKQFILAFALGSMALGYLVLYLGSNVANTSLIVPFVIGAALIGIGGNALTIGIPMMLSVTVSAAAVTAAMGLSYVFQNLGSFMATPFGQGIFAVVGSEANPSIVFLVAAVTGLILTVILFYVGIKTRKNMKST